MIWISVTRYPFVLYGLQRILFLLYFGISVVMLSFCDISKILRVQKFFFYQLYRVSTPLNLGSSISVLSFFFFIRKNCTIIHWGRADYHGHYYNYTLRSI